MLWSLGIVFFQSSYVERYEQLQEEIKTNDREMEIEDGKSMVALFSSVSFLSNTTQYWLKARKKLPCRLMFL